MGDVLVAERVAVTVAVPAALRKGFADMPSETVAEVGAGVVLSRVTVAWERSRLAPDGEVRFTMNVRGRPVNESPISGIGIV